MTERSAVHLAGVSHSWPPGPDQTSTPTPSTCGHLRSPGHALLLCAARSLEASLTVALGKASDQTCRRGGFRYLGDRLSRREVETVAKDQHPSQPFAPPPFYR